MNTRLIDKIQKLLALSESSNENEAKIAMLKAQELLVKHKLSIREVKEYKNFKHRRRIAEINNKKCDIQQSFL